MTTTISYSEWRAALEAADTQGVDDGLTRLEWEERLGRARDTTTRWIRRGVAEGWLREGMAPRERMGDHAICRRIVYALVEPEAGT